MLVLLLLVLLLLLGVAVAVVVCVCACVSWLPGKCCYPPVRLLASGRTFGRRRVAVGWMDRITHSLTLSVDEDRGVRIADRTAPEEEARGVDPGVSASSSSSVPVERTMCRSGGVARCGSPCSQIASTNECYA